jgi:hypothetical protein
MSSDVSPQQVIKVHSGLRANKSKHSHSGPMTDRPTEEVVALTPLPAIAHTAGNSFINTTVHGGQSHFGNTYNTFQHGTHTHLYGGKLRCYWIVSLPDAHATIAGHAIPISAAPKKPINMIKWRKDPHFVGREETLASMRTSLVDNGSVALSGEGGIGFVARALSYDNHADAFVSENLRLLLHFVCCGARTTPSSTSSGFMQIRSVLSIPTTDDSQTRSGSRADPSVTPTCEKL